ncbi:isoprenyl transferase [Microbacterium esteraromaticum]|uniref:Isoprenyl transferase n=1 Tax=Microbacterium esteraromaticum TaxID=57043 RepID=A0A939DV54_9MICO|nr:isoprenyl transferase [Microbacterium esteraromaticum]MBN7793143.1 isoprenyl transferase [Microbacterium esteraromaticum]MBN8205574.1 isoprenyl transferase [Microbacterium esteraromaticum]MBN8415728.1 isoprenyl transferase [Microbacterium esteraromaticum]MBN8423926.1 isoprenyl transferase [Microbacterium esteraromaticum]MBY6060539.1 isoprenyl transferase [Microbacterium esteraromaticum]
MSARESSGQGPLYRLYGNRLRRRIDPASVPHHVAMMIDGNRRWARQLGFESAADGHRAGAAKMREFLGWCDELGIRVVSLYLLSADNLTKRDSQEISDLIEIIAELADTLSQQGNWRVQHVGRSDLLPTELARVLDDAQQRTSGHTGLHVNLAVGYGGRNEIVDAVRSIIGAHNESGGTLDDLAEHLTPEMIGEHLYTGGQPDPDLVIRTSGEQRLSDFLLWQSAHSEFYFVEALGPDLRKVDFLRAIRDFADRDRRFGR